MVRRRRGGRAGRRFGSGSIGPISQSSLAALSGPQPGSSSSRGASVCVRACRSRSSSVIERVRAAAAAEQVAGDPHLRRLLVRGRACGRRRSSQTVRSSAPSGTCRVGSSSCRCQRSRCWQRRRSATRSSRWSTSSFSSRSVSSPARGPSSRGSCSAARATASASIASDLPRVAAASPLRCGQPWRHPHQPLARRKQRPARARGSHAGSPPTPTAAPRRATRPHPTTPSSTAQRPLRKRPADLVDSNRRQRVLVHVHSDHDHSDRLLPLGATGERTDLNRGKLPSSYQVTLDGQRRGDRCVPRSRLRPRWRASTKPP